MVDGKTSLKKAWQDMQLNKVILRAFEDENERRNMENICKNHFHKLFSPKTSRNYHI